MARAQVELLGLGQLAAPEGALLASVPEGWWYCARLPGQRAVQMLMTDAAMLREAAIDLPGFWRRAEVAAPCVMEQVQGWVPSGDRQIRPACSQYLQPTVGRGWVAAGDAVILQQGKVIGQTERSARDDGMGVGQGQRLGLIHQPQQ